MTTTTTTTRTAFGATITDAQAAILDTVTMADPESDMTTTTTTVQTSPTVNTGAGTVSVFTLAPEVAERLGDIRGHAAACGAIDCGHLLRSPHRAIRRACMLYVAAGAGVDVSGYLDTATPEVAAIYGVLAETSHARPTYVRGTNAAGNAAYVMTRPNVRILPDITGMRLTPERQRVAALTFEGLSQNEVAVRVDRALGTIRSHTGWLRRLTGAHDTASVVVALLVAGLIDPSVTVDIPTVPDVADSQAALDTARADAVAALTVADDETADDE